MKFTKIYLPPKRQEILNFLSAYIHRNGYAPTQFEIAKGLGFGRSLVDYHLRKLAGDKLIKFKKYQQRSLQILHFQ